MSNVTKGAARSHAARCMWWVDDVLRSLYPSVLSFQVVSNLWCAHPVVSFKARLGGSTTYVLGRIHSVCRRLLLGLRKQRPGADPPQSRRWLRESVVGDRHPRERADLVPRGAEGCGGCSRDCSWNSYRQRLALCDETRIGSHRPRVRDLYHRPLDSELRFDIELGGGGDQHVHDVHLAGGFLLVVALGETSRWLVGALQLLFCSAAVFFVTLLNLFIPCLMLDVLSAHILSIDIELVGSGDQHLHDVQLAGGILLVVAL